MAAKLAQLGLLTTLTLGGLLVSSQGVAQGCPDRPTPVVVGQVAPCTGMLLADRVAVERALDAMAARKALADLELCQDTASADTGHLERALGECERRATRLGRLASTRVAAPPPSRWRLPGWVLVGGGVLTGALLGVLADRVLH